MSKTVSTKTPKRPRPRPRPRRRAGLTAEQHAARATELDAQARAYTGSAAGELAYRDRDMAAWHRRTAAQLRALDAA